MALPAGSGTFTLLYYSRGPDGMHNVAACFPGLCPGKLDLSNDCFPEKTVSSSKPPHKESSFAAFLTVLDGIEAPGKGRREPFRVPVRPCSTLFRTVPSKGLFPGPRGPVPIQPGKEPSGSFPPALSFPLG